jgi:hypothetical protein
MTAVAVTPRNRPGPPARVWLPLLLSLALHALLGLGVGLAVSGQEGHERRPVPVDTLVLDDGAGTIILDGPARGRAGQRGAPEPGGAEESEEAFPATVAELPIVAPAPPTSAAPPAPVGGGGQPPGVAKGDGGAGQGGGILRPPATARRVVFVIDRSLSMGLSGALAVAKRELLTGLDALSPDARFGVILYNRQAEPLCPDGQTGLVPATEANRAAVARLVEGLRAAGGTDHVAALRRAIALGPDVIFFVTDADEMTAEQVRTVALLNRGRAAIHAVELNNDGERRDDTPLKLLARLSGGTHRVVPVKRQ